RDNHRRAFGDGRALLDLAHGAVVHPDVHDVGNVLIAVLFDRMARVGTPCGANDRGCGAAVSVAKLVAKQATCDASDGHTGCDLCTADALGLALAAHSHDRFDHPAIPAGFALRNDDRLAA